MRRGSVVSIFFRRIGFGVFLFGVNLWFSLFALKPVDFIPQVLVLAFKVLDFLIEGLDKVEQLADAIKGVFKFPDIVDVQTG